MANNKEQHFVPQFYLKNFTVDPEDRNIKVISVFNFKRKIHISRAAISDQCKGEYLYTNDEKYDVPIKAIEDKAAPIIWKMIIDKVRPKSGSSEHSDFLDYLNLQKNRTVAAGKILEDMYSRMASFYIKTQESKIRKELGEAKYDQMKARGLGVDAFKLKVKHPELVSVIESRKEGLVIGDLCLKILVNKTNVEFITSDAPVIFFNQWCQDLEKGGGNTGFASMGLQIFFPVSKNTMVLLYDSLIYVTKQKDQVIEVVDSKDVQQINGLQLLYAHENLYYSGDQNTKEMIDKLPIHVIRQPEDGLKYEEGTIEDQAPKKMKVLVFNQELIEMKLDLSFIGIQKPKNKTPLMERNKKFRTNAMKLIEGMEGAEFLRPGEPVVFRRGDSVDAFVTESLKKKGV